MIRNTPYVGTNTATIAFGAVNLFKAIQVRLQNKIPPKNTKG